MKRSSHSLSSALSFTPEPPGTLPVSHASPPHEKIALFRSLFRGRSDVYPLRFESTRTGRSGYQPACANEWVRGVCEKPRIKCFDCPNRRFLAVTDEVLRHHLTGKDEQDKDFVIGVYPMLLDESCHLLAVDFDRHNWREDALAFVATCRHFDLPVALERSRSGNGAHVWFFFAEALPAILARQLASHLLTETMEQHPGIGLRSYDRLFPNQDTLPKGGFGNLIALPLQGQAREMGNSVFIDQNLTPHPDQWAFLSALSRIPIDQATALTNAAEKHGRITGVCFALSENDDDGQPWTAPPSRRRAEPPLEGPLPTQLEIVQGDQLYISKVDLPPPLRNRLLRLAAFQNPEFYRAQAMRLPTHDKARIIGCAEDHPQHLALPRGCLDELHALLKDLNITPLLRDERFGGEELKLTFQGTLREDQQAAAEAMLQYDTGVLAATTAFGKTVLAAWMIAQRGVNTLVLVHRQQLLEQWVERLSQFLDITPKAIGRLGGGRKRLTGTLDVALIQSLVRKGVVDDRLDNYGHVIIDECHHLSARSFELAARRTKARFVLGLSATTTRKDGHHPIIFMQCGPIRHRVDARTQASSRPFSHQVIVRPTGFRPAATPDPDQRLEFQQLYQEISHSDARNQLIRNDVLAATKEGRSPLVLTERTQHLEELTSLLNDQVQHLITLRGGMGKKQLAQSLEQLKSIPENESRVIVATGRFVGEGFDDSRLDTLFLTLPVSWRGTIAQYVGRLHRLHHDKKVVRVYDYADLDVPMLSRMFDRRCAGYEAVGYTILLPASAMPGWPADIPLPIDPNWKRDYTASVRRLLRDQVDPPLARLFVEATREFDQTATGIARARSASEAFLYQRLQSLPETADLFQLNTRLPIPFAQSGHMEVDFLCAKHQLVIELDGHQHLEDETAYRSDRRKDALLQEQGYFVLRFLANDLGPHLDEILDTILRTLSHRALRGE
ncbi:MAG: DEAD/DEAH box helicase family protein [Verrucomicrobia bacterium]|nr:DEAD/DEAH box helicase family protein [Verrucomicrobiota bacterium]